MNTKQILASAFVVGVLFVADRGNAATITNAGSGNWNSTAANAPWPGGTVPALSDTVYIATGTVTITDVRTFTGPITVLNGATLQLPSGNNTTIFSDFSVMSGGTLNHQGNGGDFNFSGNVTNYGRFTVSGGANAGCVFTYSGSGKTLAGAITNVVATFTGSYQNLGIFVTGAGNNNLDNPIGSAGNQTLTGGGALTNLGTIFCGINVAPSIATLALSTIPNSFVIHGGNSASPYATSYDSLSYGQGAGSITLAPVTNANYLAVVNGGNAPSAWPSALSLGAGLFYFDDNSTTLSTPITMRGNVKVANNIASLGISGVFDDGGNGYSLTKFGANVLTLNPSSPESYTGNTVVNGGYLLLNFANLAAPGSGLINSSSALAFGQDYYGGGVLEMRGKGASTVNVQTFNGVTVASGGNTISNSLNGSTSSTLNLGLITRPTRGGAVEFGYSGTTTTTPITTTTPVDASGIIGGWATVSIGAATDWAVTNGSGVIAPYAGYTALPTSGGSSTVNYSSAGATLVGALSVNSIKLTGGTLALGANNLTFNPSGGLLVSANATISTSGGTIGAGAGNEWMIFTRAGANLTLNVSSGTVPLAGNIGITKSGPGTLTLNSGGSITTTFTGPFHVMQGLVDCPGISGFLSTNIIIDAGSTCQVRNVAITLTNTVLEGSGVFQGSSGGGALSLQNNVTVAPGGRGKFGVLTVGGAGGAGVTIGAGVNFHFDLSRNPGASYVVNAANAGPNNFVNDQFLYNYNSAVLTVPSTLNVTINMTDGVLGVGAYTLIDASFNSTGLSQTPTINVTWTGGSAPQRFSFAVIGKRLVLIVLESCSAPAAFTVTGGTGCNDTGVTVGLSSSTSGASYQLKRNGVDVGSPVLGTGAALDFGNQTTPGTYTVVGTSACGSSAAMTGSAIVNQSPTAFNLTGGDGCSSPGVSIGLDNSESGVSYQLYRDASPVGSPVNGTGSAIGFGNQTVAGIYTAFGSIAGCTTVSNHGTITITATPFAATGISATAGDNQVLVSWTAPGSGPTPTGYNVKRSTTSGSGYVTLGAGANVGGSPFTDTTAVNGTAYYYVVPALNGSCESTNSAPEAAATPNPSFSAFKITGTGSVVAGADNQLTITAVDAAGNPVTGITGDIALTFSGLGAAPDASLSTVKDKDGIARNLGVATTITFSSGVGSTASGAGTLVAHNAESATLHVTDGTHSTASTGGAGLALTVTAGADTGYRITATNTTPVVGETNFITIAIVDQYQNPSSFAGTTNVTFGGLGVSPDGAAPTVDGVPLGTPTPIAFSSPATAGLVARKAEGGALLTATDGTRSTSGAGGAAPTFAPTFGAPAKFGIVTQPSASATAGAAFAQQPVIVVQDAFGNAVSNSTATVTATASAGTLQGNTSVNANGTNGRATFAGLSLTNTGNITLTFSSSGLASTNSSVITVNAGAFASLAWLTQPGLAVHATPFGTQPVLATVDQFGNPTTTGLVPNMNVTVSVSAGGGTLGGTTTHNIGNNGSNGVVTFTDLQVSGAGVGKQLTATFAGYGSPVAGAAIWLDSSAAGSVLTNNSGVVTNWQDVSGNGRHFGTTLTRGSPGNIAFANTMNGRRVVTFPGTTDAANGRGLQNSTYVNNGNATTFFVVTRASAYNTWAGAFSTSSGGTDWSSPTAWSIDSGGGVGNVLRIQRNSTAVAAGNRPTGTPFLWYGGYGNNRQYVQFLTSSVVSSNSGAFTAANFGINKVAVGCRLGDPGGAISDPWVGDVAEVLIYNTYLSDADQATVSSYLSNKWINASGGALTLNPMSATTLAFNVDKASSANAIASSQNPAAFNSHLTFTSTVSGVTVPTGVVQFLTNGVALGAPAGLTSGVAVSATTSLPRGTNLVVAEYAGDSNFIGSTNSLEQVVTNTPPVAGTANYSRPAGLSIKIRISDLVTNVADVDLDTISLAGVSATTNGATLTTDSTFIYVPSSVVADAFTYTVHDGYGGTNDGTVLISIVVSTPGQVVSLTPNTNSMVTATFAGIPGYPYSVERGTNVMFSGQIMTWTTNAPTNGLFQVVDDFSDLATPPYTPAEAYYRLRYTP